MRKKYRAIRLVALAKDEVADEGVFSPDQIDALHSMLDRLAPTVDAEWCPGSNWPWQPHHPWRYRLGRTFWEWGYHLMHGRPLSAHSPKGADTQPKATNHHGEEHE